MDGRAAADGSPPRPFESFTRLEAPGALDRSECGTGRRLPWASVSCGWTTSYGANEPIPEPTAGKNFDLDAVQSRKLLRTETVQQVVVDSYRTPPIYGSAPIGVATPGCLAMLRAP